MSGYIANASTEVAATPEQVWAVLTEPDHIAVYLFGSLVETTWQVGSVITWSGEYNGRPYQDRGEVLLYERPYRLSLTHYSPLSGQPDLPENRHTLDYHLTAVPNGTRLTLTQDGCNSEEQATQFSDNWQRVLEGLRSHVEATTGIR